MCVLDRFGVRDAAYSASIVSTVVRTKTKGETMLIALREAHQSLHFPTI